MESNARLTMMTLLGTILLAGILCSPALQAAGLQQRPNVVIFVMDDVSQHDVGVFGNAVVKTPNIDRLAAEGMHFTNAFDTISSCSPSRASMLTGRYPSTTGAPGLDDPLPADVTSLPGLLRAAGYYTASIGKWHLGEPFKQQFDRVLEPRDESGSADWLPELARRPADKPFFFWLASRDAHEPYDWQPPLLHQDPAQLVLPPRVNDNAATRFTMAEYYDEIARADRNIGKVINALRKQQVLDNTLVIVLSDNGSQFGVAKTTLYDAGLKTPLVIRFPARIPAGLTNTQLVSTVDLMPTVLELVGLPLPIGVQGVSLWPTLVDPRQRVRSYVYAERNRHGHELYERAIRTETLLYKRNYLDRRLCDPQADVLWDPQPSNDDVYEELYDVQRDPLSWHSLLRDPERRSELNQARHLLNVIMENTRQKPPPLVLEQCLPRPLYERIWFSFPVPDG